MRIESLDLDRPVDAQAELDELATRLRSEGWAVEVSGIDEPHLARFLESAEHELVSVLNVVLDEAERLAIDAAILVFSAGHGAGDTSVAEREPSPP